MTQKFNYDGYTLCVSFRSENSFSMTASYNLTGQHFINDMIQLGKIKKDTVIAALSRKSQKHLWCTFKMVDSNPRTLVVSFVVKFDYLPEFSQDITLEMIEVKGQVLNKISSVELQSDMDEIQKVLDAIKQRGAITIQQKSASLTKKTQLFDFELTPGFYLVQLTGVLTNASQIGDTIQILIKRQGQEPIRLKQKTHSQHGYAYPYFFSQKIQTKGGKLLIQAENGHTGTAALSSQIVTLIPII